MTGVINIFKPQDMTSHDVVAIARGVLNTKKIGHTGTLDPMATGVLVLCIGKATKIVQFLQDDYKVYRCAMCLGASTDTQDAWGKVVSGEIIPFDAMDNTSVNLAKKLSEFGLKSTFSTISDEALDRYNILNLDSQLMNEILKPFIGDIEQLPPMYSAIKVNGKRLYDIARRGEIVDRKTRNCHIHDITVLKVCKNIVWMDITCSKGTYIRTLCHDIGQKMGCGAYMGYLCRIKNGVFSADTAIGIEEFRSWGKDVNHSHKLYKIDYALSNLPQIILKKEIFKKIKNGIKVNLYKWINKSNCCDNMYTVNKLYRVYANNSEEHIEFLGIAKCISIDPIKIIMDKNLFSNME